MECSCTKEGSHCHDLSTDCDLTCDGELVKEDGECCPVCKPKKDECKVDSASELINVDGCVSDQEVELTSCSGSCASSFMITATGATSDCKCCKPATSETFKVTLTCDGGSTKELEMVRITACACDACQHDPYGPTQQQQQEVLN